MATPLQTAYLAASGYHNPDIFFRMVLPDGAESDIEIVVGKGELKKSVVEQKLVAEYKHWNEDTEPPEGWSFEYVEVFG